MSLLPCVEVEPNQPPQASVIWLHGLGADGYDFEPVAPLLQERLSMPVRFVFPHAPERPLSIYAGMATTAWFDIVGLRDGDEREIDRASLQEAIAQVEALVEREVARGIPPQRVLLAGFSQGGALAYATALSSDLELAGLLVLSTYIPGIDAYQREGIKRPRALPVFAAHGIQDSVVPYALGVQSAQTLSHWGFDPQWREYPMGHEVSPKEIADIAGWLEQTLASAV